MQEAWIWRPSKVTQKVKELVEEQMKRTTRQQLPNFMPSYSARGWREKATMGTAHDNFDDVIWTDEFSIQLENHRHFYYQKGQHAKPKPRYVVYLHVLLLCTCIYMCVGRPKHPKYTFWLGSCRRGRTAICILEGIMNLFLFTDILDQTLVSFVWEVYPEHHRFIQD